MTDNQNLFQVFSNIFIESQQSFNKSDMELRSKCRVLSEKLLKISDQLEADPFTANLDDIHTLEEEILQVKRIAHELESRREHIEKSVASLKLSTKTKLRK